MTNTTNDLRPYDARLRLDALTSNAPDFERATEPPYYMTTADLANEMLRDMLILDDDDRLDETNLELNYYRENFDCAPADDNFDIDALFYELIDLLNILRPDPFSIHYLSQLRLDASLCPMHHCDYCACFDDDDPECATIRAYFPSHDT
jgi:hypothetical protein